MSNGGKPITFPTFLLLILPPSPQQSQCQLTHRSESQRVDNFIILTFAHVNYYLVGSHQVSAQDLFGNNSTVSYYLMALAVTAMRVRVATK